MLSGALGLAARYRWVSFNPARLARPPATENDKRAQLAGRFGARADAAILRSQPGLGTVLGARVLGEFGDDPHRYATAKGRKAFAGTAPVTRSSGLLTVVVARAACNQRLVDAC